MTNELEVFKNRLNKMGATTLLGILSKLTPEQQQWAIQMPEDEIRTAERLLTEYPPIHPREYWNGIMEEFEYCREF